MKQIKTKNHRFLIYSDYEERRLCGSLPNARWRSKEKCWSVPESPGLAAIIAHRFPEAKKMGDSGFKACLQELNDRKATLEKIKNGEVEQDYGAKLPPWKHQIKGTRFIRDMDACLIHAWMGTGKTKMTLDALANRGDKSVLVIAPTAAVAVWESEIEKHAPGIWDVHVLYDMSMNERATELRGVEEPYFIITNDTCWMEPFGDEILAREWDAVVIDESHRIKAPGSKRALFAAKLRKKAKHKVCLTGTPMPHSPLDIYGQYRFLDPAIFGTRFAAFRDKYAVMGGYENKQIFGYKNQKEMRERMDTLRIHFGKDVLDLPPIQFLDRSCELEPKAQKKYREFADQMITDIEDGVVTASNALVRVLRLQQIACGYAPKNDDPEDIVEISTAKKDLLADMIEDLDEPVVVFCRFTPDLVRVKEIAENAGRDYMEISGKRNDYKAWTDSDHENTIMGVQIQAGSEGIDLTDARVGIFYSYLSLGNYQQAYSRIHRPGQKDNTVIYRLYAKGTVERRTLRQLDKKKDIIDAILHAPREVLGLQSDEDVV